ncbi:MAG: glycoside hydrolase family 16 protein, partial [Oscillospiraceae bacterium]|nr:glycoside hydrolase family 16 protein [Oscillospiraceae bacterium]
MLESVIGLFRKLFSGIMTLLFLILPLFGEPGYARGPMVDMGKFTAEPVWADEFDGDALDLTKWKDHHWGGTTVRRGSYWNIEMAEVKDGFLNIKTEYLPEGINGGPPGFYTCGIDTNGLFEQTYGYFEVRCILPKGAGQWAAFWMLNDGMGEVTGNGHSGAEIDIFESPYYSQKSIFYHNAVSSNIHIDGYGADHKGANICKTIVRGDPYEEFHTYGLEWNEDEYII